MVKKSDLILRDISLAALPSNTVDEVQRIKFSFASETPCRVFDWNTWEIVEETLECSERAIVRDRIDAGLVQLLWNHDPDEVRGVIESVDWQGGKGYAIAKLSRNEKAQQLYQDVQDGILSGASLGYRVHQHQLIKDAVWSGTGWDIELISPKQVRAVKWEIFEISLVSIPADHNVGVGRSLSSAPKLQSLEESAFPEFDFDFVCQLKSYPSIWNLSDDAANKAFDCWEKYRNSAIDDKLRIDWINRRETFLKRNYQAFSLKDIVNQVKWAGFSETGIEATRTLLLMETRKMDEQLNKIKALQEETEQLRSQLELAQAELQRLQARELCSKKYLEIRSLGEKLLSDTKISANEFNSLFSRSLETILTEQDPTRSLDNIEFYLSQCQTRSPLLPTQQKVITDLPQVQQPQNSRKAASKYESAWKERS